MNSRFFIYPYCEADGKRTFSDEQIRGLYRRMVEDGTAGLVFMGSGIDGEDAFLAVMQSPGTHPYVLFVQGLPAGIVWLNRIQYRWAQMHFCTFREVWGRTAVELGRHVNRTLLEMRDSRGRYCLDMLVGILPARNRLAVSYVRKCFGRITGELPRGVYNPQTGQSEKAYIITLTREGIRNESD